ncbi:hypothetical protein PEM37_28660 [Streptomyces sp. AD681]|uniref:hypothetical protein n=1 Tax=Streptomyces sp. AD681 TaxID=3019069 RepID=UPI0022F16BF7|nr:hypothetical protein [Streptomyces sp. AD681]MDA5145487.1 hypothetical protein [Streptomyces sp. AD681]
MTAEPAPFKPSLVKAVFRDVTPLHVSRSAAWAAASVTRTVLTEIVDGARRAAAEQSRRKLIPGDLISATDRDVELEVGGTWYEHSPTFRCRTGDLYDADGVLVPLRQRRGPRTPSAVAGAHRFEAGVRKLLRSRGATAVPAMVRDLDGIASVFLTDLARRAAVVVREGGVKRFGTVILGTPDEAAALPFPKDVLGALSTRTGDRRTVGRDDVLAATTMVLFGNLRQRALTEAKVPTGNIPASTGDEGDV